MKPVRMKNSLYLLIPKGISELLELDQTRECTLTTHTEEGRPILSYAFSSKETRGERERLAKARVGSGPRAPIRSGTS